MGAYDCDCINNLEYDRRERKQKEQPQSTAQSTAQSTNLIERQAAIDGKIVIQRTNGVEIYSDEAVPVEYLKNLPSRQPEPSTNCSEFPNNSDTVSRQAAIDAINSWRGRFSEEYNEAIDDCENSIIELPPAQSEPSIPVAWIEGRIEWLNNMDNYFAELTANIIKTMLNEWRKGQTDNVD